MVELYDNVAEPKVQEKEFKTLQRHQSADVDNLTSLMTWYIRVNQHVCEKTFILVDHDGEETPSEDEIKTHAEVEKCVQ